MMFAIEVQNARGFQIDETQLVSAAATVLTQQHAPSDSALTVVITDDEAVAALNHQYRGIDAPTDVLSFPADPMPQDKPPYLGDLIIAYPYTLMQAASAGHDADDSLALLVVHGTLHLLGSDHDTLEHRSAMWAAQETALRALGIPPGIVPALESYDHQT
jgi:probable rRNA maturation factor